MAVKKKRRTAKQIAATKKLVALNKKRRATKKKTVKRKTVKRSPAKRKINPSPRFYVAFVRVGNSKYYYSGYDADKKRATFDDNIEKALWYRDKKQAIDEVTFLGKTTRSLHPRKHKVEVEPFTPGK